MLIKLHEIIQQIGPICEDAVQECRKRWDGMAKPLHSLGKLEDSICQIAGIQADAKIDIKKKALIIMCADNGVVEEGVTQTGQEVTAIVAENFLDEKSCVAIMCKDTNTGIYPIDIGMATDTQRVERHKIRYGTANIAKGPAMTREEAEAAVLVGIQKVMELKQQGYQLIATGEMGIGNTTTSSAMCACLLGCPPAEVTGRGAGLSTKGLEKKIHVIETALNLLHPDETDPMDILAKVGGLDIAGLVGVFLGCAAAGIPVVMDGFISAVAAVTAIRIAPKASPYILASHVSKEPAGERVLEAMGKNPMLTCDLCLGEGSGAVAIFPLLDLAVSIYYKMGTFQDSAIEAYQELE